MVHRLLVICGHFYFYFRLFCFFPVGSILLLADYFWILLHCRVSPREGLPFLGLVSFKLPLLHLFYSEVGLSALYRSNFTPEQRWSILYWTGQKIEARLWIPTKNLCFIGTVLGVIEVHKLPHGIWFLW